jgi:hypothetical protein
MVCVCVRNNVDSDYKRFPDICVCVCVLQYRFECDDTHKSFCCPQCTNNIAQLEYF